MNTRAGLASDLPFLESMLVEAFEWSNRGVRRDLALWRSDPEFSKWLADWGRPGDRAVVAMAAETKTPLGAAWYRRWTHTEHSYGFVRPEVPELAIGVDPSARSHGAGRLMMMALIEGARTDGMPALSLSVDPDNFARRLYESFGFRQVGASGTSITMLLELAE